MKPLVAQDIMNPRVLSVQDDLTVTELAAFLIDNELSGAPVRDGRGRVVGVVSLTDLARAAAEGNHLVRDYSSPDFYVQGWEDTVPAEELREFHVQDGQLEVRDIMTPAVFGVPYDTPVADLAEIMSDSHIHRLLVTRGAETVGIVTSTDVMGALAAKN